MESKTDQLKNLLNEAAAILNQVEEERWGGWFEDCIAYLEEDVLSAVRQIIGAYGGMGSLNDLVLHPINGHKMTEKEINPINERFYALVNEIFSLAYDVRTEVVMGRD